MSPHASELNEQLRKLEQRLPAGLASVVRWLRQPLSGFVRVPLACALILGGIVGFLPILGFWMIPLGLLLLAQDVPFLRRPIARFVAWAEAKLPARKPAKSD
jgi:hypothetical protein